MDRWIYNPKTKGSGIITCIPQTGECPQKCEDCFFQSGRSYLEPLDKNLPHVPSVELAEGRIVRMNDGHDSNYQRELVMKTAQRYKDYFYNTSIPKDLKEFGAPVVLTVNPAAMTDTKFHKVEKVPNLMFVRVRTNAWNIQSVVQPAVDYYSSQAVSVVLTFMAYYVSAPKVQEFYEWKQRTLNSYWVLKKQAMRKIMLLFEDNPYVYSCGVKDQHACKFCGNCIREYYNTKERTRRLGAS